MGFRSTFVTEDYGQEWPQWFINKYADRLHFPVSRGPISTKFEIKIYDDSIFVDMQKAMTEGQEVSQVRVVVLHECGGITLVDINASGIRYSEPRAFESVDFIEHNYCYGCSDPNATDQRAGPVPG
jgi:hypothetical protein